MNNRATTLAVAAAPFALSLGSEFKVALAVGTVTRGVLMGALPPSRGARPTFKLL